MTQLKLLKGSDPVAKREIGKGRVLYNPKELSQIGLGPSSREFLRARAIRYNRAVRFGMRAHIVVRETDAEAAADAERLIAHFSEEDIARAQTAISSSDSVGRRRMRELHGGDRTRVWLRKGLWSGIGLVRGGAGTSFVGSPDTIAELIREYQAIGVETFILSGYPHIEEAYRVAELIFPEFKNVPDHKPVKPEAMSAVKF